MSEKVTIEVSPEEFQALRDQITRVADRMQDVVAQEHTRQARQEAANIENDRRQAEYEAAQKRVEAREEFRIEVIKQQQELLQRQTTLMQMQVAISERIAGVLERVAKKWA